MSQEELESLLLDVCHLEKTNVTLREIVKRSSLDRLLLNMKLLIGNTDTLYDQCTTILIYLRKIIQLYKPYQPQHEILQKYIIQFTYWLLEYQNSRRWTRVKHWCFRTYTRARFKCSRW